VTSFFLSLLIPQSAFAVGHLAKRLLTLAEAPAREFYDPFFWGVLPPTKASFQVVETALIEQTIPEGDWDCLLDF
jgi:hypothetical protein